MTDMYSWSCVSMTDIISLMSVMRDNFFWFMIMKDNLVMSYLRCQSWEIVMRKLSHWRRYEKISLWEISLPRDHYRVSVMIESTLSDNFIWHLSNDNYWEIITKSHLYDVISERSTTECQLYRYYSLIMIVTIITEMTTLRYHHRKLFSDVGHDKVISL